MKRTNLILLAVAAFAGLQPQAMAQITLGSAASYGVLAGTSVVSTGSTIVNGDLGVSPGATVTETPAMTVTGTRHINDGIASTAQSALTVAYDFVTAQTASALDMSAVVNGTILTPGVYSSGTVGIDGTLTLNGNSADVFIFKIGSTITTGASSHVLLTGGAQANNVFWQVGSSATLSGTDFSGNILALTSITLTGGAMVDGRLLARNGTVSLIGNTITVPTAVPEPATTALIAAFGALGLAFWRRHRAAS